ncbi:MAG: hypothetical protein E5X11_08275, partial [Mesorhizobium sp.]
DETLRRERHRHRWTADGGVESPQGAHTLTVTRGSDFETMVRLASRPAERPDLPQPGAPTPEMMATLTRLCAENGIDIVGPPMEG